MSSWDLLGLLADDRSCDRGCPRLSAADAIAWARGRADDVFIRFGIGGYFWAGIGEGPTDVPRWPPPDPPQLTRRCHPDYAYLDRSSRDAPIDWKVHLWVGRARPLEPEHGRALRLEDSDGLIHDVAQRAGASWDDGQRRQLRHDLRQAQQAAARYGHPDEYGWTSSGRDAYRLTLRVSASTQDRAGAVARAQLDLPPTLVVEDIEAEPLTDPD